MKYAFRCQNCGHLLPSEVAGEHCTPHCCPVCKHGVGWGHTFDAALAHAHCQKHSESIKACPNLRKCGLSTPDGRHVLVPGPVEIHRVLVHENWEILADCTSERLTELGLSPGDVEKHTPWPRMAKFGQPKHVELAAEDGIRTEDKSE